MCRWLFRRLFYRCLWNVLKEDKANALWLGGMFLFCLICAIGLTVGFLFDIFSNSEQSALIIATALLYSLAAGSIIYYLKGLISLARERMAEQAAVEYVQYRPLNIPNIVIMGHNNDGDQDNDDEVSSEPSGYGSGQLGSVSGGSRSPSDRSASTSGTSGYVSAEGPFQVAAVASEPALSVSAPVLPQSQPVLPQTVQPLSQSEPALHACVPPVPESAPVLPSSAPLSTESVTVFPTFVPPLTESVPASVPSLTESVPASVPSLTESLPASVPPLTESALGLLESVTVIPGAVTAHQTVLVEPRAMPSVFNVISTISKSFAPTPPEPQIGDSEFRQGLDALKDSAVFVYEELEVQRSQSNPEELREISYPEEEGFKSVEEMQVGLIRRTIRSIQEEQPTKTKDELYRTNSSE